MCVLRSTPFRNGVERVTHAFQSVPSLLLLSCFWHAPGSILRILSSSFEAPSISWSSAATTMPNCTMSEYPLLLASKSWLGRRPSLLGLSWSAQKHFQGGLNLLFDCAGFAMHVQSSRGAAVVWLFTSRMASPIFHSIGFMWLYATAPNRRVELPQTRHHRRIELRRRGMCWNMYAMAMPCPVPCTSRLTNAPVTLKLAQI